MALTVKSRRRVASSSGRKGSPVTSKPRCPGATLLSRRGRLTSMAAAPAAPGASPGGTTL